jgi:hypothetical protein
MQKDCFSVPLKNKLAEIKGEEHRCRVCGNRVHRRTSGPKVEEATGGWRKLSYEELRNL